MISTILVIIVLLLSLAYFYLKCSPISSFTTFLAALLSLIPAFNYFELISNFIISKGYIMSAAPGLSFILLFIVSFAILKSGFDFVAGSNIDFGPAAKYASSIIFGIATGIIFTGVILITTTMTPLPRKLVHSRFPSEGAINPNLAKNSFLNTDGIVVGLFEFVSNGSLSKTKPNPFDRINKDFLDKIHLSYGKVRDGVYPVAADGSVKIAEDDVKRINTDGQLTIKAGLKSRMIPDGGALAPDSRNISFMLAQARIRYDYRDDYRVEYPTGYVIKGKEPVNENASLGEVLDLGSEQTEEGFAYCKLAYDIPKDAENLVLQFKLNSQTAIPEIEENPER